MHIMEQKIFHGQLTPDDVARHLVGRFNRGNIRAQQFGNDQQVVVQIGTPGQPVSGGQTALSVHLLKVEDGISVTIGQQAWLGIAASLGSSALAAFHNPMMLLGRLDDIAQDIESLQLTDEVLKAVQEYAHSVGTGFELSDRLRRMVCEYCNTANAVGEDRCIACGAPLGSVQPRTCPNCGFVLRFGESRCPNCDSQIK